MSPSQSLTAAALLATLSTGTDLKAAPGQSDFSKATAPKYAQSRLPEQSNHQAADNTRLATSPILKRLAYSKHSDGSFEITLPIDLSVQQAGEALNKEAKALGLKNPVFDESHSKTWSQNELMLRFSSIPGKTYHLQVQATSISKSREEQTKAFGALQPMGALALAEACEALQSRQTESLLVVNQVPVIVRTSHDIFAIRSSGPRGVRPCLISDSANSARGSDTGERRHPLIAAVSAAPQVK